MKKLLLLSAAIIGLLIVPFADTLAQDVKLTRWVIGSGGMVMQTNSENIEMSGVTGQVAIEKVSDGSTDVFQGFWVPDENKVGVEEQINAAQSTKLSNYPNPFSNQTTIHYELDNISNITIRIYDVMGNIIREVYNGEQNDGAHEIVWDAKDINGQELSSGSYIFELTVNPTNGSTAFVVRNIMAVVK